MSDGHGRALDLAGEVAAASLLRESGHGRGRWRIDIFGCLIYLPSLHALDDIGTRAKVVGTVRVDFFGGNGEESY